MSINLESVFYLWYIVLLPVLEVNNCVMSRKIRVMPWLPYMQELKQLTICWRSFSGCGREHVAVVFATKGCQYLINGCLQPIWTRITQGAKLKIADAPLTLILRMRRWPCCCLFCLNELPICWLCITVTKSLFKYHTCKTTNHWRSVDAHSNVLSIQQLLPSLIVLIMIWTYWLSVWQMKTRPCGKAKCSNILAWFALTQLKFT